MATIPSNFLDKVQLGETEYKILSGFLVSAFDENGVPSEVKNWADILALVSGSFELILSTNAANTPIGVTWEDDFTQSTITGTLEASAAAHPSIYFVPSENGQLSADRREYIPVRDGSTWKWEKIGHTDFDLSQYAKKGTYAGSAASAGAHTHTVTGSVTVPTVSITNTKIGAKIDSTDTVDQFSFGKKSLTTTTIKGVAGTTGIVPAVAIAAGSRPTKTVYSNANAVTGFGTEDTTGSLMSSAVVESGVLKFKYKTPTTGSFSNISSNTEVAVATAGTAVTVATAASSDTTVATGALTSGSDIIVSATPTAKTFITGVSLESSASLSATGTVSAVESVSVGTASASLANGSAASNGAHTHTTSTVVNG